MAIQPISQLQSSARNLSALDSILARGGASFDNAISNAVQVGRDLANKQAQQERNFQTEQRREINLSQRRAENFRQNFEDDRSFIESGRRYEQDRADTQERFDLTRGDQLDVREEGKRQFDLDFGLRKEEAAREAKAFPLKMAIRDKEAEASLLNSQRNLEAAKARVVEATTKAQKEVAARNLKEAQLAQRTQIRAAFNKFVQDDNLEDAGELFDLAVTEDLGFTDSDRDELGARIGRGKRTSQARVENIDKKASRREILQARRIVADINAREKNLMDEEGKSLSAADIKLRAENEAILEMEDEEGRTGTKPSVKDNIDIFGKDR